MMTLRIQGTQVVTLHFITHEISFHIDVAEGVTCTMVVASPPTDKKSTMTKLFGTKRGAQNPDLTPKQNPPP